MQASYEPVDLAQVTAELASVFRSAVDRAGLAFEVDCPPLPEPVYLDRGMWEKVVLNLLSNALKFTFDGSIRIAVRAEGGQAVVTVADTGIGVPEQEMPRLFERFHRIENARSRSNEGSGIGLALVQELVQLHGGTITASSTEGEGTTFTIRLPFGHAHLPAGALVPAGHAATVSATADPFVQEALRWLPGTVQDGDDGTGTRPVHEEITPGSDADASRADGPRPARAGAGRRRQRRHARVPGPAAAHRRLPGHHGHRRAGRPGRCPRRHPRPGDQRRDDAPPGRPGPGGRPARRHAHRSRAGAAAVGAGRAGGVRRGPAGGRRRLPGQAVLRGGTAGPGALQPGDGQVQEPRVAVPPHLDRLPAGRLLRHRRGRHHPGGQSGLPGPGGLQPGRLAVPLAAPLGSGPRRRPRRVGGDGPGVHRLPARTAAAGTRSRYGTATGTPSGWRAARPACPARTGAAGCSSAPRGT